MTTSTSSRPSFSSSIEASASTPTAAGVDRYAAGCAWIEGELVPIGQARIPITDTGFTRSDCTYDVVSVWRGSFFRLDDHLARFARSCRALRLAPPLAIETMREILIECVSASGLRDAYVEMILTRGSPPPGVRDPRRFTPRFYAFAIPYVWLLRPEDQHRGAHLAIAREVVRIDPAAVDPTVKNFHWGDLTRGLYEAYDRGADQALLLNANGDITEGPGFNLFARVGDVLWTPAQGVLLGITRQTVLELCAELGQATRVAPFGIELLAQASEIFMSSTAGGIMPVTRLDGRAVGDGKPGPWTMELHAAYWTAHARPNWSTAVDYAR